MGILYSTSVVFYFDYNTCSDDDDATVSVIVNLIITVKGKLIILYATLLVVMHNHTIKYVGRNVNS